MSESARDATTLFRAYRNGEEEALAALLPLVYDELRRIARRQLRREYAAPTISTTGLVHEAYLKLINQAEASWQDRAQFCALSARAMRQILVDRARRRHAQKRGGRQRRLTLDENLVVADARADRFVALDEALDRLEAYDPRLARIVEYRFFGGLSVEETAEVLGVSVRTVYRDWLRAKAFVYDHLEEENEGGG